MMQKLPAVTGKDIVRVLQKVGWVLCRVRGSHHHLEHPVTGQRITIAVHAGKDMRSWLVKEILEEVNLDTDKFRKLL